jgi:hypothetical protein
MSTSSTAALRVRSAGVMAEYTTENTTETEAA